MTDQVKPVAALRADLIDRSILPAPGEPPIDRLERRLRAIQRDLVQPAHTPPRASPDAPGADASDLDPLIAIVLLGLRGEGLRAQVRAVARMAARAGFAPLCVVDDETCFADLRRAALPFEHIPSPMARDRVSRSLPWDLYLARRAQLLEEKWRPARVLAIGPEAEVFAALWPRPAPARTPSDRGASRLWSRMRGALRRQ